ncbi:MAG: histidine--tRNA ligase [Patescibacteria group bacterium]|nr:histidine--tRNA ligase [Patescibacteria group bacterium]
MKLKFQSPTGMHDILREDHRYRKRINEIVESIAGFYNFEKIDTPILEQQELFSKGIGLSTDIIKKEMFTLRTKGRDYLALRPEGTAPVVRAYIEHGMKNLPRPVNLWYSGPLFRYEKPQAGRFRQFWQFGLESIGEESPAIDAQIVQMTFSMFEELKIKNVVVEVNSIGASCCRPYYKKLLVSYLRARVNTLCPNCEKRIKENPLRILDCKQEKCKKTISEVPQTINHLCVDCRKHFKEFLEFLDELELPYNLNPHLVRGLDYYTRTVFEFFVQEKKQESSEITTIALAAGGRYDGLVKLLGGKPTPAVGIAGGIDRIMLLMKDQGIKIPKKKAPKVFLAQLGNLAKRKTLKLVEDFRKAKTSLYFSLGRDSLRAQLKIADKVGVDYSLILGQQEALANSIIIREMKTGKQTEVKLDKVVEEIKKRLKK